VILRRATALLCASLLVSGPNAAAPTARTAPAPTIGELPLNYTPPPDSDEAGLWMISSEVEKGFRSSPLLVRDPALNSYVKGVVCKVAPDRCNAMRIYILDIPYFNAAMSPNGAMQVWTGLLLRARNEAQLAYILGHETSHYTLRHTIDMWRRARSATGGLMVLTLLTAGVGALAAIGMMHSLMAHSRDEERQADEYGLRMATAAGYDPAQSAEIWRLQAAEEKVTPKHEDIFSFTDTHPTPEERLSTMQKRAAEVSQTRTDWVLNQQAYLDTVKPFRARWLEEDLALGHYDASLLMINDLIANEPESGLLRFYLGEIYRRRNAPGDAPKAVEAYEAAAKLADVPPTVYRGLGITQMKSGNKDAAREAFQKYLAAAPDAGDHAMVEYYLSHL